MLLSLALLLPPAIIRAQSGRNTQQQKSKQTGPAATRPKRVTPASQQQPTPTPGPSPDAPPLVPTGNVISEAPPPWPGKAPSVSASAPAKSADTSAETPAVEVDPSEIVHINSNLVTVPATVVDDRGKAVTDLKLEDFELRVDGQPKPISEIGHSETPVRMAFLFDNSSSIINVRDFEKHAAVKFFRSVMRPVDQAAIYYIYTVPVLSQPLTGDVQTLVRTIEHFGKPEGATALFDGMAQAAAYLKPQQGRKVIVIISDGADTISDLDFETTLRRVQAADCQVYVVQTGLIENANVHDLAAERRMQEFAAQTGGAVYTPKGTSDLDVAFAQISADLAQQYVLSYYPADERKDGRFRTLSLRVTSRRDVRVRARKGYYPPKT